MDLSTPRRLAGLRVLLLPAKCRLWFFHNYMSVVFGICSNNFVALWADMRLTSYAGDTPSVVNDTTNKIVKLNPNVRIGVTGSFSADEEIMDAVTNISNVERASAKIVKNAIVAYLRKAHQDGRNFVTRNYTIGGKVKGDGFVLFGVHWNPATKKPEVQEYKPTTTLPFAVTMSLPTQDPICQSETLKNIQRVVKIATSFEVLDYGMRRLISEIAKRDASVSPNSASLLIT